MKTMALTVEKINKVKVFQKKVKSQGKKHDSTHGKVMSKGIQ